MNLTEHVATYALLWARLGHVYTFFGGLMVAGGLLFGASALRVRWLPPVAVWLFLAGIGSNLLLALLPAPDILQTLGSAIRNSGLVAMGCAVLTDVVRSPGHGHEHGAQHGQSHHEPRRRRIR